MVHVRLGDAYSRFGRVLARRWVRNAVHEWIGRWVYDVGPVDPLAQTNIVGAFNEGQLDEVDAVTLLAALTDEPGTLLYTRRESAPEGADA